uniref:Reverse transcriptase domain-containing protein n=1 Tax=Oncorhynchus kisutch TaxID=8019 RepID=A0A8C7GQZ2_ONCKI
MYSKHFPTQSVQTGGPNVDPRMLLQGHGSEEQSLEANEKDKQKRKINTVQSSEHVKRTCKSKHCLVNDGLWISGPRGESGSPPRKIVICGKASFQDKSHASGPDPPNDLTGKEDVDSVVPQCVGKSKTPTPEARDGGRNVGQPPQPVQAAQVATVSRQGTGLIPSTLLVSIPVRDLRCGLCEKPLGAIGATVKHYKVVHPRVTVVYGCSVCGKSSKNSHSISCHVPKCKGVMGAGGEAGGDHGCGHCPKSFATVMGLTQHKRHQHIEVYCREKEGKVPAGKRGKSVRTALGRRGEESEIKRLSKELTGEQDVNRLIAESLGTGRTAEQVKQIRRKMRLEEMRMDQTKEACDKRDIVGMLSKPGRPPTPQNAIRRILRDRLVGDATEGGVQIGKVRLSLRGVEQNPTLLSTSALELQRSLRGGQRTRALRNPPGERKIALPNEGRLIERQMEYGVVQKMFLKNQARLSKRILDGDVSGAKVTPSLEIALAFKRRWEVTENYYGLGQFSSAGKAANGEFESLVSAAEVCENLGAIKNGTAAGPDGVTKTALLKWDPTGAKLAATFSIWLTAGTLPGPFKECRTTLIPKSGDPVVLTQEAGWRPLTIGSVVLRLYSRILTHRLARACPISPRQRGFIASPGCSENLMILDGLIRQSWARGEMLAVVLVDFARAFDSVSHVHILDVLRQRGLDEHIIGVVGDLYTSITTTIKVSGELSPPIDVRVGVKQGDPMSPLLFNLALDPMIETLERCGQGYQLDDQQITTLAFADDLVLVSGSWDGMAHNILILEKFCRMTGLRIQPRKCHGFLIQKAGGARLVNLCEPWTMCGEILHMVGPEESVAYLGMMVSPWHGIIEPEPVERLCNWISSIGRSPLKPSQKVGMLGCYAVPRMVYRADHGGLGPKVLMVLDGMIRRAVKEWLHLPMCTCDGLLYSEKQDGGLGVVKLACQIPSIQARRVYRLWHSKDDITRLVTRRAVKADEYRGMWLRAGGDEASLPPLEVVIRGAVQGTEPTGSVKPKSPVAPNWRQEEFLRWQNLTSQGVGVQVFGRDKNSNHWLANPEKWGFKQRHYIAGLQLRANVYPTREALARGRQDLPKTCRHCLSETESCSHILGQCPFVKDSRIARHHKLCDLLTNEAESNGWSVTREMCCRTRAGALRRPDLVCVKDGNALVVDVTVRYEMAFDTLKVAAAEKVARYTPITQYVKTALKVKRVRVYGFPLGARGKWPMDNNRLMRALGVSGSREKRLAKLFSRRALLYSLDVLRDFYRVDGVTVDSDDQSEGELSEAC